MAKVKISEFSSTAGNNTDIDGINLAEGMAPSLVNDAIRELMAQLKDFQTGAVGDSFNGPINGTVGATTASTGAFTSVTATGNITSSGTLQALGTVQSSSGADLSLNANGANRDVIVKVNGTEQARFVGSTGNFGIGTSSPASKLDISGGGTTAKFNTLDTYDGGASLSAWMKVGRRAGTGTNAYINTLHSGSDAVSALTFAFGTSGTGTETLRLASADGTVILKNGSTSATGTGITFPATQSASTDANTLDDYEEGTWTPTAYGSTTAGTTTYALQQGTYTKIGNQVTVSVRIAWSALTGTGELTFGGFPFASVNNNMEYMGATMTDALNWGGGTYLTLYKNANTTTAVLFYMADDANWNVQQCVNETAAIRFTVTYFTT